MSASRSNPLLLQFLAESRDGLQEIAETLMELERAPDDVDLMTSLFRAVHTLKGNSGLFEFREMTRVLHAGEDLLDRVRHGQVPFSSSLADRLLDAMDYVGVLCGDIERDGVIAAGQVAESTRLTESLRQLLLSARAGESGTAATASSATASSATASSATAEEGVLRGQGNAVGVKRRARALASLPPHIRLSVSGHAARGETLHFVEYLPDAGSSFRALIRCCRPEPRRARCGDGSRRARCGHR
jgi:two-component system chemotaxis sensor kinase CheA